MIDACCTHSIIIKLNTGVTGMSDRTKFLHNIEESLLFNGLKSKVRYFIRFWDAE